MTPTIRAFVLLLGLLSLCLPALGEAASSTEGSCSNALTTLVERYLDVSSVQGIALKLLRKVQDQCTSNKCPHADIASTCKNQSIDDIHCKMKHIFSTSVKPFTDDICNAGCDDWPCKAACNGIDTGICYGSDWILCKAGCLGIHSCVHKCEHAIVDPCKEKLIDECSEKCENAFNSCKVACEKKLIMEISGDFDRLQHIVTSMNISSLEVNCSGNGVMSPATLQARAAVRVSDAALDLTVHVSDAGVSTSNVVHLQKIALTLGVPFSGYLHCGLFTQNITLQVGQGAVSSFDLDLDIELDQKLDTIAAVVCADLSFCKSSIKRKIASAIKDKIIKEVPPKVAAQLQPVLQNLANKVHCPKFGRSSPAAEDSPMVV